MSQPTPEQIQAKFDLGIWHALFNWGALTIGVQNQWGGPDSKDKRDWLAGRISDLFDERPDTDAFDLEDVLVGFMQDEFNVNVEDESEVPVAKRIMDIRKEVLEGNFAAVDELQAKWEAKNGQEVAPGNVQIIEHEQEGDWDSVDEESDADEDEEMGDAPALVPAAPKEKPEPEVDEEGFTKVVGKKRR